MNKFIALGVAVVGLLAVVPAHAADKDDGVVIGGDAPRFHDKADHVERGHALDPIFHRYPQPDFFANEFNIPAGAGVPAPHAAPERVYAEGEAAVPLRVRSVDAKGRATHDRHRGPRRAAWDR